MRKTCKAAVGATILLGALAALELYARAGLGLGTPPLYVSDPEIEYMFAPDQDMMRFGNHQRFNHYGMRSDDTPPTKPEGEYRVLAIGDSVLNGGSLTDQADLATTLLTKDGIRVLNASAGSWGPENMLAYVDRFGLFDADLVVVVLSSHDAADVPSFQPLNPGTHPQSAPLLALTEAAFRYLPRYLAHLSAGGAAVKGDVPPSETAPIAASALDAVRALSALPVPVCVVLHPNREEHRTGVRAAGFVAIREAAGATTVIDEAPFIRSETAYRDPIHPSAEGQRALAGAISACSDRLSPGAEHVAE
ncbi:hypothetical protein ATI53_10619 [Salipiger aestuarii]|uniref:GDSL-like lipase/acylhydrolase family protein n=1 Tax=Salipiger aestuarii TaxID=568098 RepID=A0A327XMC0_9RHOB|nr:SGNH/GDSL hydrolase family protein [Salipiger aestuarii]RAK09933.1 hypothetical protein ATI53_10619 [Salipiger aestuarii]